MFGLLVPNVRDQASSPKRSQCEKKRGEDGAAVKIHRRRGRNEFWAPQEVAMVGVLRCRFDDIQCYSLIPAVTKVTVFLFAKPQNS